MAKYRVKKGCQLLYPDGSVRGTYGYIVDGDRERQTLADQGDALERSRDRQTQVSPVDASRMDAPKPKTAKKTTKKKASKKKAS